MTKLEARKAYLKAHKAAKYQATPKGKAALKRYRNSPKGKAVHVRYNSSPKGQAHNTRNAATRRIRFNAVLINDLTGEQWEAILKEHNFLCNYCHQPKKLTMDHVVPLSKGGNHTASNIVPVCKSCNSRKGTKLVLDILP